MTKNETEENKGMSNDEKKLFAVNKFLWVDNEKFKIISNDGIERILIPNYYS